MTMVDGASTIQERVIGVIGRYERSFLVAQNALQRSLCCGLEQAVDLLRCRCALYFEHAVRQRSVEQGNSYGMPIQAACQFRVDQCDRRGTACGGRDQRVQRRSGRRKSLAGRSTIVWVFVTSWIVVIDPCLMVRFSWITFTKGARQLDVQLAASNNAMVVWVIDTFIDTIDDVRGITVLNRR